MAERIRRLLQKLRSLPQIERLRTLLFSARARVRPLASSAITWVRSLDHRRQALLVAGVVLAAALPLGALSVCSSAQAISLGAFPEPPPVDDSTLRVVQSSPGGAIEDLALIKEVVVVFNHPMVPLAKLEEQAGGAFRLKPSVPGRFRWYGSRACAFLPTHGLAPGTTYAIEVGSDARALNGKKMKDGFRAEFVTPHLSVVESEPREGRSSSTIPYDQTFLIRFNYPVDLAAVSRHVELNAGGKRHRFSVSYAAINSTPDSNPDTVHRKSTILIRPSGALPRDSAVKLTISKDLTPAGGSNGMQSNHELSYQTAGPLTVELKEYEYGRKDDYFHPWRYSFEFNNDVDLRRAASAVSLTPRAALRYKPRGVGRSLSLSSWHLRPQTKYRITVARSLQDRLGNALAGENSFSAEMGPFAPRVSAESGHRTIEAQMAQKLPVTVANTQSIEVSVGPFSPKDLQATLKRGYKGGLFDELGTRNVNWKTAVGPAQTRLLGYDIAGFLKQKRGWLAVRFEQQGSSPEFVQSTDLALTVKLGESSADAWVHSLTGGGPLGGTTITAYDADRTVDSCRTDGEGHCRLKHDGRLLVAQRGDDRSYVLDGQHSRYLWRYGVSNSESSSSFNAQVVYDRGLYRPGEKVSLKALLMLRAGGSVRPLAEKDGKVELSITDSRGGELLKRSLTLTKHGGASADLELPAAVPTGHCRVSISVTRGKRPVGSATSSFQVEEFRPVDFAVEIEDLRESQVGRTLKPIIRGKFLFGAPMQKADVTYTVRRTAFSVDLPQFAGYTFGDEAARAGGMSDVIRSGEGRLDFTGAFRLDFPASALALADTPAGKSPPYRLEVEARVKNAADQSVARSASAQVFPGAHMIGIKSRQAYGQYRSPFSFDLISVTNSGNRGSSIAATIRVEQEEWKSIRTVGPGGARQAERTRVVTTVQSQGFTVSPDTSTFTFQPPRAGTYIVTVAEASGAAYSRTRVYAFGGEDWGWYGDDEETVPVIPDRSSYQPGDTATVLIRSPYKEARAVVTVERENVLWQKTVDIKGGGATVQIPIKEEYLPNVFVGAMLLVPRTAAPAGAPKGFHEEDQGAPRFRMGITRLNVEPDSRRALLTLATDRPSYHPGDQVVINIQTEPGAEIALSVADRGVLDLINYNYQDPLEVFYRDWPLVVRVMENIGDLIKQLQFRDAPGGGEYDDRSSGGFPFQNEDGSRKDFRYTAFWNPTIMADGAGRAVVKFKLPDNLTTFRIMALVASGARMGRASHEFQVNRPLVILPLTPRFIRPGDRLEMGAVLVNHTGQDQKVRLRLTTDLLAADGGGPGAEKTVELANGQSRDVSFRVSLNVRAFLKKKAQLRLASGPSKKAGTPAAEQKLESGVVVHGFLVSQTEPKEGTKAEMDKVSFQFPVHESPPVEAFTVGGFTDGRVQEGLRIPSSAEVLGDMGHLDLSLSSTALSGIERGFRFFEVSPYFCLEQRASAFLLAMTAGKLLPEFGFVPSGVKQFDFGKTEALFLGDIGHFQNSDGGFRVWKDGTVRRSDPYLTAYAIFVMQVAREKDYSVPGGVYRKAIGYLHQFLKRPEQEARGYVLETLALSYYVFARAGERTDSLERALLSHEKELSLRARGYLALGLALKRGIKRFADDPDTTRLFQDFRNRMQISTQSVSFQDLPEGSFWSAFYTRGAVGGVLLQALVRLDSDNPLIPQMISFALRDSAMFWSDSHSAGQLAYALDAYHQRFEKDGSSQTGSVQVLNQELLRAALDAKKKPVMTKRIPLAQVLKLGAPGVVHPLAFIRSGAPRGRLYYTATLQYAPALSQVGPRDEGLEIRREVFALRDLNRTQGRSGAVKNLTRGETYLYRLTVVNPKPRFNFAIYDPVPSSVEIVNAAFATEGTGLARVLEGRREPEGQGGYWWFRPEQPTYEYRDDHVLITNQYLSAGMHEYYYLGRALLRGRAAAPSAKAFLMYEPEVFGRTKAGVQDVR